MTHQDQFLRFLDLYVRQDLDGILAMLSPDAAVRDWHQSVRGQAGVAAFMRQNFSEAESLSIDVLALHASEDAVAGEVRILVDGSIELFVVDVMRFDAAGRIAEIRSYKGRGP